MAYDDDSVLAKLSALNETQESIVTVAQWVMFHRRHADRTGQLWLQRLKDSGSNKRLNLIYLANEVAQQSKARRKDEFLIALSPVIAEATSTAYKGATNEVQQKLRRVVEVWRQRQIFELPIQEAIEARIDELDKSRSSNRHGGGSIFSSSSSSIPPELSSIVTAQQTLSKLILSTKTSINTSNQDYDKLTNPNVPPPSAPVHVARLSGLLNALANAEGAVAESIKARQILISALTKLLETNQSALSTEQTQLELTQARRAEIDNKRREVEESIMRGFATGSNPCTPSSSSPGGVLQKSPVTPAPEPDRPEVEALTPPGYPAPPQTDPVPEFDLNQHLFPNGAQQIQQPQVQQPVRQVQQPGSDLLSSLTTNTYRQSSGSGIGSVKKRKLNTNDDFPDLGGDVMDGLDADVAEMLRRDSGNGF